MNHFFVVLALLWGLFAHASGSFPGGPDPSLTPGSLCDTPDRYRYRENIPYCERDVSTSLKYEIIRTYDRERGFRISQMQRADFKIDHYIPLCMGGSNKEDNLWPQHQSIFKITDPLEQLLCQKLAVGAIDQRSAIQLLQLGKNDLSKVPEIIRQVESGRAAQRQFGQFGQLIQYDRY